MEFARHLHEGGIRAGDNERGDPGRNIRRQPLADEAGPGMGPGKIVGVFAVVVERQMHRTGQPERGQVTDGPIRMGRVGQTRARGRGDLRQRQS